MTRMARAAWLSVVLQLWLAGSLVAAAVVLLGTDDLGTAVIVAFAAFVIGPAVGSIATSRTEKERDRAVRTALAEHRDPGHELRTAVDEAARRTLRTSVRTRWLLGLSMTALAAACLVAAVHRGHVAAALPALSLAALGVLADLGWRKEQREARRWLDDPPVPVAADD